MSSGSCPWNPVQLVTFEFLRPVRPEHEDGFGRTPLPQPPAGPRSFSAGRSSRGCARIRKPRSEGAHRPARQSVRELADELGPGGQAVDSVDDPRPEHAPCGHRAVPQYHAAPFSGEVHPGEDRILGGLLAVSNEFRYISGTCLTFSSSTLRRPWRSSGGACPPGSSA